MSDIVALAAEVAEEKTDDIILTGGEHALSEIIVMANEEMRIAKAVLEVEESGRKVANTQGKISGIKKLISAICAEFHLTQIAVEDTGDESAIVPDLDDEAFELAKKSRDELAERDDWKKVLARIQGIIDYSKNFLLFQAEKVRDLDIKQGELAGMTVYKRYFDSITGDASRRDRKAAEAKSEPFLPFDGEEEKTEGDEWRTNETEAVSDGVAPEFLPDAPELAEVF